MKNKWNDVNKKMPKIYGKFQESNHLLCLTEECDVPVVAWYNKINNRWTVSHFHANSLPINVIKWKKIT